MFNVSVRIEYGAVRVQGFFIIFKFYTREHQIHW